MFPKQAVAVGVLACSLLVADPGPELGATAAKNVAKTLEISTSAKIKLLWLQCGGRSVHAAAATATFFRKTYKTHEIFIFFWSKSRLPYNNI